MTPDATQGTFPPPSLRVALFHATLPEPGRKVGGVEVTVHRLANALVQYAGCDVTVFSCGSPASGAFYHHKMISLPRNVPGRLGRLAYLPMRLNFVNFSDFDVLHLHGDDWFFVHRRLPTVRTLHGSALLEARFAQTWRRKLLQYVIYPLEHLAARLATVRVAVGTEAASIYHASGVANNGVDTSLFKPREKSPEPLLFYVGTWRGRKRGEFAFRLFVDQVLPQWPTAKLFMACDNVPDHASVINGGFPPQEALADWMSRSWVFLYPSLYEGFGIPYAEALASGTAIVTSPNSGADYVLEQGRYGLIAEDAEFAIGIDRMLRDEGLRQSFEQNGLRRADVFSWQNVSREHVQVYDTTMKKFGA